MSTSSTAVITDEELKIILEKKKAYEEAYKAGAANAQALALEYFASFIGAMIGNIATGTPPPVPGPVPGCGPDPDPNDEHIAHGGWGGDLGSPETWDAVAMKDDPSKFKVVDKAGKNIAHNFATEKEADDYIKYHQCMKEAGTVDPGPGSCPPGQHRDSAGICVPDTPGPTPTPGTTPYPIKGTPMQAGQRGPTERHYASGAPDDWTIEKNVKNIPFENYQWVTYVTMGPIEHDDNISVKFGGLHMGGGGWWDCGISFGEKGKAGSSQSCLGIEPKHPSTKLCVVKGKKYDSVLEKKVGVAGVVFKKTGKIELWIDMGTGWDKACEGTNVGGLNPTKGNTEAQLRIDGFNYSGKKDETDMAKIVAAGGPNVHSAVVTEI